MQNASVGQPVNNDGVKMTRSLIAGFVFAYKCDYNWLN